MSWKKVLRVSRLFILCLACPACVCAAKSFMFILVRKTSAINTALSSSQQREQGAVGCRGQLGWRNMAGKGGLNRI